MVPLNYANAYIMLYQQPAMQPKQIESKQQTLLLYFY